MYTKNYVSTESDSFYISKYSRSLCTCSWGVLTFKLSGIVALIKICLSVCFLESRLEIEEANLTLQAISINHDEEFFISFESKIDFAQNSLEK